MKIHKFTEITRQMRIAKTGKNPYTIGFRKT